MKVFLSFSGEVSHKIAAAFEAWLPEVIQQVQPYLSSSMEKGIPWGKELSEELKSTNFGILCITREAVTAPWLNFEAGSLAKQVDIAHVVPFLLAMEKEALPQNSPLLQFQMVRFDKDDVETLVKTINAKCESPLSESRLTRAFERCWPDLQARLDKLLPVATDAYVDTVTAAADRDVADMIKEVLAIVREEQRGRIALESEWRLAIPRSRFSDERTEDRVLAVMEDRITDIGAFAATLPLDQEQARQFSELTGSAMNSMHDIRTMLRVPRRRSRSGQASPALTLGLSRGLAVSAEVVSAKDAVGD